MRHVLIATACLLAVAQPVHAEIKRVDFGKLPDGQPVEALTLSNHHGMSVTVLTLGASIQALSAPDRAGKSADIALGYASLDGYVANPQYFGATVGRFANRIAKGTFALDGQTFHVPVNNGVNSLHGGTKGFDKVLWEVVATSDHSVTLRYVSPDGDMGYPGTLTATAVYRLDEDNRLTIDYSATTDKPTVVNLSNHTYFNVAGEGAPQGAMGLVVTIPADRYLPTDAGAIPTGEMRPVAGTVFDFRKPTAIAARVRDADQQIVRGKGYDHNWIVSLKPVAKPRLMARVADPVSGRVLEVLSDQPGIQFYSGNFLDATTVGKSGKLYRQGDAIALEPQLFPDAPNHPDFASARLDPGQTYHNTIVYHLTTDTK